jgi:hypothetical protein
MHAICRSERQQNDSFIYPFSEPFPLQLQQVTTLLQTGLQEQRTPPQVSLDGVVSQIRGMLKSEEGLQQAFFAPIKRRCLFFFE